MSSVGWLWEQESWAGEALSCLFGLVQLLGSAGPPVRAAGCGRAARAASRVGSLLVWLVEFRGTAWTLLEAVDQRWP